MNLKRHGSDTNVHSDMGGSGGRGGGYAALRVFVNSRALH